MNFLTVLAQHAHLEGDEGAASGFSQIDSDFLMANWYKIVIALVLAACLIGLIVGNLRYFLKKRKHKDD